MKSFPRTSTNNRHESRERARFGAWADSADVAVWRAATIIGPAFIATIVVAVWDGASPRLDWTKLRQFGSDVQARRTLGLLWGLKLKHTRDFLFILINYFIFRKTDSARTSMQHPTLQIRDKLLTGLDRDYNVRNRNKVGSGFCFKIYFQ